MPLPTQADITPRTHTRTPGRLTPRFSHAAIVLVAVTAVAAFYRFFRLDQFPPGLQFDESYYLFDTLRVVQGNFSLFFTANNGREPLFMYLSTVAVALFGAQELSMRLMAAFIGTTTVALTFGFVRTLFRSTAVAGFSAFFAAISIWHIYNSRSGQRVILVVPLTVLTLWLFWMALERVYSTRDNRRAWRIFAMSGLCLALSTYTYLSGRLIPIVLVALTLFALLTYRTRIKETLAGLALTGITAIVLCLPLGLYFYTHPQDLFSHASNLSIFDVRINNGNPMGALAYNLTAVAGMFLVQGDRLGFRNVYNRPVFDPVSGAFFVAGLALLVLSIIWPRTTARARLRSLFIATGICVFMAVSVLSDDPPNFGRTLAAVPLVMILPGYAAATIWERWGSGRLRPLVAGGLAICLLASATSSFYDYFITFAQNPATYYALDVDRYDAANWVNQIGKQNTLFLAPLWSQHGTVTFLTRNTPLRSFESRDTVILPSAATGKDALYAFPFEQEKRATTFAERVGPMAKREAMTGTNGAQLLIVYRVPASALPDPADPLRALAGGSDFVHPQKQERTAWQNNMELLGYTVSPEGPGGRNLTVTLFLSALAPIPEDYTFSVKVRDDKDRTFGQEDKWPGDNSYATSQWLPGDVVIEKFYPGLSACAPAGEYHVTVEAYSPKTGAVLPLADRPGTLVQLSTLQAGPSESNRLQDLEPDKTVDGQATPRARLFGYTLTPGDVKPNGGFSLSLFWQGAGAGSTDKVSIGIQDSAKQRVTLAEREVKIPVQDRGLCTLLDLRVPGGMRPGPASIWVNDYRLGDINIVE